MTRALVAAAFLLVPRLALACPVCFGQSDSPMAKATNLGIIVMLVIVGIVLAGFAAFIVNLARRANVAVQADTHGLHDGNRFAEGDARC